MHKLYLDPFMDMCNGEIISFGIAPQPSAKNVMDALEQAITVTADCPYRRTFHSDYGEDTSILSKMLDQNNLNENSNQFAKHLHHSSKQHKQK